MQVGNSWLLALYLVIIVLPCKQYHQVYGVNNWYFVHFACWHKVSFIGEDTILLGRLAKAGCFGFVGNTCDAFGRKCGLSGTWA
jgi:hypothetical protein